MVPLDRALVSSYRLSIVTMSLTAAVWLQFAMQVCRGGIRRLTCIGSYVNKQVTTFAFRAQATTCSIHHTRTVMDQFASVHHEYGRLALVTAGLLFDMIIGIWYCSSLYWQEICCVSSLLCAAMVTAVIWKTGLLKCDL